MSSGALAIDRTDDRMGGPLVLSVLVHLAAAGLLLLVSVSCDWCAVVPSGLRPFLCPSRCHKVKIIKVTPAYTISLVTMPPLGRLTAGGRAKKPIKPAARPASLKAGRTSPKPAARTRPRTRPVKKPAAQPPPEPTLPPLPAMAVTPPTRPRAEKLPLKKTVQPVKKAPSLKAAISRIAEAKPSPEALKRLEAIRQAKARALDKARKLAQARAKKLAEARAHAKRLAAARAAAQARAKALERKLARLKKKTAGRGRPGHLTAAQKIARLEKRSRTGFGPGRDPGNYGVPSGRPNGGGGTPESYYATLVEQRVVRTLRRYGRWTKRKVHVTLLVRVARSGRLMWARVYKGSGDPVYDDRVLGAVQGIRQFVPFPPAISRSWLEFEITIHSSAISGQA
jgi:TolA protein